MLGIRVIPGNQNRGRQLLFGSEQYGVPRWSYCISYGFSAPKFVQYHGAHVL